MLHARLDPVGQVATASNVTLLCRLSPLKQSGDDPDHSDQLLAVYKPQRGETPLWDFPSGTLHRREVAAYVLDRELGWGLVPPTVLREDGPYGRGSVQLFVEHDPQQHYFALVQAGDASVVAQLQRMVVFDLIANNADRKASHVLLDGAGRIRLVDHGVCFHEDAKLRTVAWEFAGEPIPESLRSGVAELTGRLADHDDPVNRGLAALLTAGEVAATARRARAVADRERFPPPTGRRPYPWPPL
ncbi:MAG: SCO1664 family protein [Actinobacteria bacterium]|nr:SCO1664 family protein [Actinomycetota bacterium]